MERWQLQEQLCFLLYASSRNTIKAYKEILDPFGLTYTQYITLVALWEGDNQLVSELGKRLDLDSGTLTPVLKRLEKDGRLTRVRDDVDNRKVYIKLTEAGVELGETCKVVPEKIIKAMDIDVHKARSLSHALKDYLKMIEEKI